LDFRSGNKQKVGRREKKRNLEFKKVRGREGKNRSSEVKKMRS
jgi:hypothetical protein